MKNLAIPFLLLLFMFNSLFAQGRPQYQIVTERADTVFGVMKIELLPTIAPKHTAYFDSLVNIKFYDSTAFHRVVPSFVIQGGDPNSINGPRDTWGYGDPAQKTIPAEFTDVKQVRGTIGAARDEDINSANSQFYINLINNSGLTPNYTCYGIVVEGMDVADKIVAVPRDPNDNPIEKISMFVTKLGINNVSVAAPELVFPQDGAEGIKPKDKFEWDAVDGALLYNIQIAKDAEFTDVDYDENVGVNSASYSELETGVKTFYWRVSSNNGGMISDFSEARSFTTSINAPMLLYPEHDAADIPIDVALTWGKVEGAVSYKLEVAKATSFVPLSMVYSADNIQDTSIVPEGLQEGKRYYWRVRGFTNNYEGDVSEVFRFVTAQATDVDEDNIPTEYSLSQNYPNPFNPSTTINYTIPVVDALSQPAHEAGAVEGQHVTLKIYDMLGNEIAVLVNEQKAPGRYQVSFDASSLASGIYFYKINVEDKFTSTKKLLLLK